MTVDVPTCPIATPAVNDRLAELRAEVLGALAELPPRRHPARARGVVGRHRRSARRDHRARSATSPCSSRPATSSRTTPSCCRASSPTSPREAAAGGARFLVDAYCGSGLLGLAAAPRFERVLGVEVSESAVRWARANAERNDRDNCDVRRRRRDLHLRRRSPSPAPTPR